MELRFISWDSAALHIFVLFFPVIWSLEQIKAIPSRKSEVSAGHWNYVYSPADEKSRLNFGPGERQW